jgi:transposase
VRQIAEKLGRLPSTHRAVATRFDKLAVRYEATIQVAGIDIWLRCLERHP